MKDDWYKDFFEGVALDFWRQAMPPLQTGVEADFIVDALSPPKGGKLLDCPCGDGRHMAKLASRGFRVTGVDVSRYCLEAARARLEEAGLSDMADLVQADMTDMDVGEGYGGAYCMGNSFGYLDRGAMDRFLGAVSRSLLPGAGLILETAMAAESFFPTFQERDFMKVGDITLLMRHEYHPGQSRLDTEYTFIRDGEVQVRGSRYWIFTMGEIKRMIGKAGMKMDAVFGAPDKRPYRLGSPAALIVARK